MPLTEKHRYRFVLLFCGFFYALMFHKLWNGFFLFQLQPHIFNTRFDLTTWIVMKTGIHQLFLNNRAAALAFDIVFYSLPLCYLFFYRFNKFAALMIAIMMAVVNFVYIQCYTLYPANSIESFTAWLLFPFLLMTTSLTSFYYLLNALRYFFLFFFASAGIWKIVQGGLFNLEQMEGILLYQHKEYLITSPDDWYTNFIYWLTAHGSVSFSLYVAATIVELIFIVGFFTKRFDKILIAAFVAFLLMDILIMRIPYWEVTPFLLTLVYSKYAAPKETRH